MVAVLVTQNLCYNHALVQVHKQATLNGYRYKYPSHNYLALVAAQAPNQSRNKKYASLNIQSCKHRPLHNLLIPNFPLLTKIILIYFS
jgi:hypothetical protein